MTELEEDDVFLRTDDCIYLQCTRTHENKERCKIGLIFLVIFSDFCTKLKQDTTKVCLAAESFGSRLCFAEKTQFTVSSRKFLSKNSKNSSPEKMNKFDHPELQTAYL